MEVIDLNSDDKISSSDFKKLVEAIKNDKIIIYPTDTIYGIGGNACSNAVAKKIFDLKGRKNEDVFSVLVDGVETIKKYAKVGSLEEQFLDKYLPGSLTVILSLKDDVLRQNILSDYTINSRGAVGFRVIEKYDFLKEIVRRTGVPLITTSANKSGVGIIESNVDFVLNQFANDLDEITYIINGGDLNNIEPSTVVDLSVVPYSIIRRGAVDFNIEDLKNGNI